MQKPKDDWDLKTRTFSILDDETGQVENFQINAFHSTAQFCALMIKRYPDTVEFMAHSFRHAQIMKFISDNEKGLIKEGLLIQANEQSGIKTELVEALCALPFSLKKVNEEGEEEFHFLYQEVVEKTRELMTPPRT